ncbi:hypothetical protein [Dactylosporangium sp. CS-033363]|uniref:hypothetical protein n=1 Tax=Dactylosporangium sp. CS-033363 TaxID=3239935 RepID=UPI003D92B0F6
MSTVRIKVDRGRRLPWLTPWLAAGLGLAALVVVAGGGYLHRRFEPAVGARPLFPAFDPIAAAARSDLFTKNPPVGAPMVVSDRSSQPNLPPRKRFSMVVWYSADGKFCGSWVRRPDGNAAFCSYVNVDGSPKVTDEPGMIMFSTLGDRGFLWVAGKVPAGVTSVTAVSTAGVTSTAPVLTMPDWAPFSFFTMTLYSADQDLGTIRFTGAVASGQVVTTRDTDDLGRSV